MRLHVPGIYDISSAEYHADPTPEPSLSSSIAQTLLSRSPLHAWTEHPRLNPNHEREEKEEFDFGNACHALLLQGEDHMVVVRADNWRTKAAQEARDAARAEGKYPLLEAKYETIFKMRDAAVLAIANCEQLSGLTLADGKPEQSIVWTEMDVTCRIRTDWISNDHRVVLDYKSTTDATPRAFTRQIVRMGYHLQDAFYSRGVAALFGKKPKFIFVAQESEKPFSCSFHGCAPSLAQLAAQDIEYAIRLWAQCVRTNKWPAYDQRIHWAEALPWQMDEHEERLQGNPYNVADLWQKQAQEEDAAV